MTQYPQGPGADSPNDNAPSTRRWQIALVVVGLLAVTLLIINVVLRVRLDAAAESQSQAVSAAETLKSENAELTSRSEELLNQLSTSNERLTELVSQLKVTKEQLAAADADVRRQVATQNAAERAAERANSGVGQQRARVAALEAQLRNAQTCSAATIRAFAQIHAGPDIESGADEAAATLDGVLPACRAGLR